MRLGDYFNSKEYDVVDCKEIQGGLLFEFTYFKNIERNYENVSVYFEVNDEDEIRLLRVETHSYFDEENPRRQCLLCGSNELTEDLEFEDADPTSTHFVHVCGFDMESVQKLVKESYQMEMFRYHFSDADFEDNWSVSFRDDKEKVYGLMDEWLGMKMYLIQDEKVYHAIPSYEDVEWCPYCSSMESTHEYGGMRYRLCPVMTKHADFLVERIENREQDAAKLSHEERLAIYQHANG